MSRSSCVQGARFGLLLARKVAPVPMPAQPITPAAAPQEAQASEPGAEQLSPGQKMNNRYPQSVRAGFPVGLPVPEEGDTTLGSVAAPTFALGAGYAGRR